MEGVIRENVLENNLLTKLQKNGIKVIHLKHHIKFLQTCREYDVTLNGLIMKKSPNIFPVSPSFSEEWQSIIKNTENQLTEKVLQESKSSLNLKLTEFHRNLINYLQEHNDISNIQKFLATYQS